MGPVFQEAVPPRLRVQSKSSPFRLVHEQKPPSKVQLLIIGGGVVGGGVGGTAIDGTTEQRVVANEMSSTAISPVTDLPRTASNTTCEEYKDIRHLIEFHQSYSLKLPHLCNLTENKDEGP